MKKHMPIKFFILVEICVVAFIISATGNLPENIASHFNGAGVPNGFMSQKGYLIFMLVFAVGIPAVVVGGISVALRSAQGSINIPNKNYWLAPERKQETIEFLNGHMAWFGSIFAVFLSYVHWLLIKANSVQPAQLSINHLFLGIGALLVSIFLWGTLLSVKFMRVPKS
jgi:uncharacterized membrane protein